MKKFEERIADNSLWFTATPTPLAQTLPFYISEAGHFQAEEDYLVERNEHDSFLLLYTVSGCGRINTKDTEIVLPGNYAVMIDCHDYHRYHTNGNGWEFLWLHLKGLSVKTFFDILYPNEVYAVEVSPSQSFFQFASEIIHNTQKNGVVSDIKLSSDIHEMFHLLIHAALKTEQEKRKYGYHIDMEKSIAFIKEHYGEAITVDDMIKDIPISKYHFIRLFNRTMGVTPYNYLTTYRINISKTYLRTTDKSITEIAEACGFLDTSNFITQFKKRTGQIPTQYRRDFS